MRAHRTINCTIAYEKNDCNNERTEIAIRPNEPLASEIGQDKLRISNRRCAN